MKYLALFLGLFFSTLLTAQSACDYDKLLQEGKSFARKRLYKKALYKYNSARRCDPSKGETVDLAIERLLFQIEGEKKAADKERATADSALVEVKKLLVKNKKIIDAFYFYAGKYALAFKDRKFGFIDPEGNYIIKNIYDEAATFNSNGFARVSRDSQLYLIDTLGMEYRVTTKPELLSPQITALDLSGRGWTYLPSEIFSHQQLKILLLSGNNLDSLPADIGRLPNLQVLDISSNILKYLPPEIGSLKYLYLLDLSGNSPRPPEFDTAAGDISKYKGLKNLPFDSISNLKSLKVLDLRYTYINKYKVDELHKILPGCNILWRSMAD